MGVRGRFALVTGAASGMGRATAMMLAAEEGHAETIHVLKELGADVTATRQDG